MRDLLGHHIRLLEKNIRRPLLQAGFRILLLTLLKIVAGVRSCQGSKEGGIDFSEKSVLWSYFALVGGVINHSSPGFLLPEQKGHPLLPALWD
jgi:hypothetical protein